MEQHFQVPKVVKIENGIAWQKAGARKTNYSSRRTETDRQLVKSSDDFNGFINFPISRWVL